MTLRSPIPLTAEAQLAALYRRVWRAAELAVKRALEGGETSRPALARAIALELRRLDPGVVVSHVARRVEASTRRFVRRHSGRAVPDDDVVSSVLRAQWAEEVGFELRRLLLGLSATADASRWYRVPSMLDMAVSAVQSGGDAAAAFSSSAGRALRRVAARARATVLAFGSKANETVQRAVGVERYVWRTRGDDRVRDSHAERNGRTFTWAAPPPGGHPGTEHNCRCVAVPVRRRV